MTLEEWVINHVVEVISLLVAIIGLFSVAYLKNKSQRVSIGNNSSHNTIIQSQEGDEQIKKFEKGSKNMVAFYKDSL